MNRPAKSVLFGLIALLLTWICLWENGPSKAGFFDGLVSGTSNCGGNSSALTSKIRGKALNFFAEKAQIFFLFSLMC